MNFPSARCRLRPLKYFCTVHFCSHPCLADLRAAINVIPGIGSQEANYLFKKISKLFQIGKNNLLHSYFRLLAVIIILFSSTVLRSAPTASGSTISGTVTTSNSRPAEAVTVRLGDTKRSTLTDEDGYFSLHRLAAGRYTLEISLVGYATLTREVTVEGGGTVNVALKLKLSERQLQDVVVAGARSGLVKTSNDDLAKVLLRDDHPSRLVSRMS